jgi:hypothetical protein
MRTYKPKHCTTCGTEYLPTGQCSKYCLTCREIAYQAQQVTGQERYRRRQGMEIGRGARPGEKNPMYSHGRFVFLRWAKERKLSIGLCEHCNKDIRNATHYEWVGHHKDHNQSNNVIENLVLLCKRCHQVEHQCWDAFKGVTTSRKT